MTLDEHEAMVAGGAFEGRGHDCLDSRYLVAKMPRNSDHLIAEEMLGVAPSRFAAFSFDSPDARGSRSEQAMTG